MRSRIADIAAPPEFDPSHYRASYPELEAFDDEQLWEHYRTVGRDSGWQASAAASRPGFPLQLLLQPEVSVLEIGPFCGPNMHGPNVRYFDVLDEAGLVERAAIKGISSSGVKPIDFVHPEGDLGWIPDRFDAVYSSHCIEHAPDLLHHFRQVSDLLLEDGRYYLMIPDRRYCFDHYLPDTTADELLSAHAERRRLHSLTSIVDHVSLTTHNDSARHWAGDHCEPGFWQTVVDRVGYAVAHYRSDPGGYLDAHAWQFTPDSFRTAMDELANRDQTPLVPLRVYDTPYGCNEFGAILTKRSRHVE